MEAHLQRYGEHGCLIRGINKEWRSIVEAALRDHPPEGLCEYVPGYDNMLLLCADSVSLSKVANWIGALPEDLPGGVRAGRRVEIPVVYEGPDLAEVARQTGLTEAEVVAAHSAPEYRVRMMGFAPGFPYLDGLDRRLHLERRKSPRNYIEPGSVAIGGAHAGIYSVASPGGWHILGRTETVLFRPDRAKGTEVAPREIFALAPGDRVQFIVKD